MIKIIAISCTQIFFFSANCVTLFFYGKVPNAQQRRSKIRFVTAIFCGVGHLYPPPPRITIVNINILYKIGKFIEIKSNSLTQRIFASIVCYEKQKNVTGIQ